MALDLKTVGKISTTFGKETVFNGILKFSDTLKIDGKFEGEIISEGHLFIEEGAVVKADINVRSLVIAGVVLGNIVAGEKLEMLSTAKVFGNIKAENVRMADGVVLKGNCEMIKDCSSLDIFSAPIDKLKTLVKNDY